MRLPFGAVLVAVLFGAGTASVPATPAWSKPTANPAEKTAATVAPAVLYLEVRWHGAVRDRTTGALYDPAAVDLSTRCSGFAVSNDGYLVTAGHCVDPGPEGIAPAFYAAIADRYQRAGRLAPADRSAFLTTLAGNADIEGDGLGQPAVRTVTVQRGEVTPGRRTGADVFPAQVVDVQAHSAGDVAVLKADKTNQPIAVLAGVSTPDAGTDVLALGYPVPSTGVTPVHVAAESGAIGGPMTTEGAPFYGVVAATSPGMDGGPVVNDNGEVLGLLSRPPSDTGGPRTLSPVSVIAKALTKNQVHNVPGKVDNDYRDGLNDYYNGRYTEAIAEFDSVLAMVPSHIEAQQYQQKAVSLRESEGEPVDPHVVLYGAIGAAVIVLILVLLITLLIVRGRRRRASAQAVAVRRGPDSTQLGAAAGGPVDTAPQSRPATRPPAPPLVPVPAPAPAPAPDANDPSAGHVFVEARHVPEQETPPEHRSQPEQDYQQLPSVIDPEPGPQPVVPSKWDLDLPPLEPGAGVLTPAADGLTGQDQAPADAAGVEQPVLRRPPPPSLHYCSNCGNAAPAGTTSCAVCGQTLV